MGCRIGAGVDQYVGTRYGPDLIDCAKEGPEYYQRMFAHMGIDPAEMRGA